MLVQIVWLMWLNLADLLPTLNLHGHGDLEEANPVAAWLLSRGAWCLVCWKMGVVTAAAILFAAYPLRPRLIATTLAGLNLVTAAVVGVGLYANWLVGF